MQHPLMQKLGLGSSLQDTSDKAKISPAMKTALELGPIVLFVIAFNFGDRFIEAFGITGVLSKPLFLATAVIMIATPIAIGISWFYTRTLPAMPLVTLVIVTIFGGLTLYFENETFIKMKPTIINTLFGVALLAGLYFGKSLLKIIMDSAFSMDDEGWRILTFRWGLFFLFLAVVNEIVWRNFSEGFWVGFKLWGMTGLSMTFVLSQTPMMQRHALEEE